MTGQESPSPLATSDVQRAIRQQLESLKRAGVTQIGSIPPFESPSLDAVEPQPTVASAAPVAGTEPPQPLVVHTTDSMSPTIGKAVDVEQTTPSPVADSNRTKALQVLADQVAACTLCQELCASRTQTVFGVGDPHARIVFFGEAPGADEDRQGEPFVGAAGQLLTKIIQAMSLQRDEVYILNTLKCRPPDNRNPLPDEVAACRPFFVRQLEIIQPDYIVCLGAVSSQNLLGTTLGIGKLRGRFHEWSGAKVVATYHPAYLLRNTDAKKMVWDDMKMLMADME